MNKKELLLKIEHAIKLMKDEKVNKNKGKLQEIIDSFERAKIRLNNNELTFNAVRGAARIYADIYGYHTDIIPECLYDVEKRMDEFLKENTQ
ncbi:hypothetical protein [Photorhabdus khanii]|uniref:Uncharacterized protein n=1 Tax=Photorhabdus khanii subsp. guanajuatensis TaxID=2100166 RepID=A0A4R4IKM4_9GAMM|nr:hypothetical protein [Photorhabdus khanii]TDB40832.1 hypothetical protein C5467_24735 [Photorhabdus khanii subsp. guanajuatensis]